MTDLFFVEPLLAASGSTVKVLVIIAFLFAIFVLPFILGNVIGRLLKLKELAGRISLVLCVTFCGLAPFVWPFIGYQFQIEEYNAQEADWEKISKEHEEKFEKYQEVKKKFEEGGSLGKKPIRPAELVRMKKPVKPAWGNMVRKGIDLAGGTNLIFQVQFDKLETPAENKSATMDKMVGAIKKRLNPSGTEDVVVRRVGEDRIEVIIPGADEETVREKKKLMTKLGSLEIAVLATSGYPEHPPIIRKAMDLPPQENIVKEGGENGGVPQIIARWHDVAVDPVKKEIKFRGSTRGGLVSRPKIGKDGKPAKDAEGNTILQFLVIYEDEDQRVTGKDITNASPSRDKSGTPIVSFAFNSDGAYNFGQLTTKYQPKKADQFYYHLAILLDGEIQSAPTINEPITGGRGQITIGNNREVQELVNVLNAGALEVPINPDPVQELTISPTLGADVIQKGLGAIMVAGGIVLIFMIAYYWVAGFVADLCLLLNIILVMGAMVLINAAFTLPGLAGIVLTIGMAVDANVLIFERIREEINRGSSTRMAIQNGFDRAFTTIVDANVTTLLTAIVLYMIGTDQVKGFAVTLFIGIVMSMFTALYFGRLVFDILEQKRWLKTINMFSIIGKTSIDFISKKGIATVVSLILIAIGMVALVSRRSHLLDIDFTGGTMITMQVDQPATSAEVRKVLEPVLGTTITIEQLSLSSEEATSEKGVHFRLRTTKRDSKEGVVKKDEVKEPTVKELVDKAFQSAFKAKTTQLKLLYNIAKAGSITEVPRGNVVLDNPDNVNRFSGGHQVEITFDNKVSKSTVLSTLAEEIEKIKLKNKTKYEDAETYLEAKQVTPEKTEVEKEKRTPAGTRFKTWKVQATKAISQEDFKASVVSMEKWTAEHPMFEGVSSFDSSVASEMKQSAFMAMFASLIAIIGYIWFRFQRITFGLAAVVALVHDVLIVLGMVAISNWLVGGMGIQFLKMEEFKINLPMIAAFLTIVGYSLNDTIVVFDRIREVRGKNPNITVEMLNLSLNQTLSRTILTSLTTFMVVAILYFFGGEGIHGFAFCLVLGVIVGTYSSIYVASPVLLWLMNRAEEKAKQDAAAV